MPYETVFVNIKSGYGSLLAQLKSILEAQLAAPRDVLVGRYVTIDKPLKRCAPRLRRAEELGITAPYVLYDLDLKPGDAPISGIGDTVALSGLIRCA